MTFKTAPASVGNLSEPRVGTTRPVGWSSGHWIANAFTTGRGATGFTLERITLLFGDSGPMPRPLYDLRVQLHGSGTGGGPGTALATLSGPARPDENAEAIYTCAGSGCALLPGATYHVVLSVPGVIGSTGRYYPWQRAATAHEAAAPAGSGWRIANDGWHTHDGGATWTRLAKVAMFGVEYGMPAPALTASAITETAATLTLANEGGEGAWYAKRISPSAGTCSAAISGGFGLTELTAGTGYTYAAYRDAACTMVVASGTFTTLRTLTASNVTDTTATLSIVRRSGAWYAKYTSPAGGTCSTAINADSTNLTGLDRNTAYSYEAYSDTGCTTVIGRTAFTTEANWLTATSIGMAAATLTLTGHTGDWYVKETSPATGLCSAGDQRNDARPGQPDEGHDLHLRGVQRQRLHGGDPQRDVQHADRRADERHVQHDVREREQHLERDMAAERRRQRERRLRGAGAAQGFGGLVVTGPRGRRRGP